VDTFKPDGASLQYLKPAEYVDGRKVAGVRSLSPAIAAVNTLKEHFGKRQLRGITHADIRAFGPKDSQNPPKQRNSEALPQSTASSRSFEDFLISRSAKAGFCEIPCGAATR